jgi:hypothetical protein
MSIATIMIINIAAAGTLSVILAAVMLAPVRSLRSSQERAAARRPRAQRRPLPAMRPVEDAS